MQRINLTGLMLLLVLLVCPCAVEAVTPLVQQEDSASETRVSKFGKYSGYTEERFSEWTTTSQYVEMPDGVKLAVDIVRPSVDGKAVDEKLPVIWTHSRYHRGPGELIKHFGGGEGPPILSSVDALTDLQRLVKHGYCFVAVGVRGGGASFGTSTGLMSPEETQDSYHVIDWISKQPWCDGNVGMHGVSYLGMTQYMAASKGHPALKAIFPNLAAFDLYDTVYPGGVFREDMANHWQQLTYALDNEIASAPVATDPDGKMLQEAMAGHRNNWNVARGYRNAKFRNSTADGSSYLTHNLCPYLNQINEAKVPAYHWGGWYDVFVSDTLLWYANYEGPQKLAIGSWSHAESTDESIMVKRMRLRSAEQHRWFDYWLKGIDNGIMDEPPINIGTLVEPGVENWTTLQQWPAPGAQSRTFFFTGNNSMSIQSVNDGSLEVLKPDNPDQRDAYAVDFETTTGAASRWDNAVGAATMDYPDMTANDVKCLTYTTPQLQSDLIVTGHPVATLYVESASGDADFHVLLEEIDSTGKSHYISEGILRASHRRESQATWNNLDLPYHRSFEQDQERLPEGQPTVLNIALLPVSNIFNKNNRIRVSIMGADKDNTEPPPVDDGTQVFVHRSDRFASRIDLPVIEAAKLEGDGK